jgi:hypothetical protein
LRRRYQLFWMNVNFIMILSVILILFWINIDYLIFLYRLN